MAEPWAAVWGKVGEVGADPPKPREPLIVVTRRGISALLE